MSIMGGNAVVLYGVQIASNELIWEKNLFMSDVNGNCRLAVSKKMVKERLKFCTPNQIRQVNDKGMLP